ncbi:MAG: hypothetical protein IT560_14565 [Alphaproteobacteria bacterium]|jgi:hypothetical protein|nr:hypothetical protein [Alphaproteobacteria bacterium]
MARLDTHADPESYETRELAWELQQPHPDEQRIKFFVEHEACVKSALKLANMAEKDLLKRPSLRVLHKHLHDGDVKTTSH